MQDRIPFSSPIRNPAKMMTVYVNVVAAVLACWPPLPSSSVNGPPPPSLGYSPFSSPTIILGAALHSTPPSWPLQWVPDQPGPCISVWVPQGCCNKTSQTRWLTITETYSLTVRSWKSRCWQGWHLLEALRENLLHASHVASGSCWQSLAFLGL